MALGEYEEKFIDSERLDLFEDFYDTFTQIPTHPDYQNELTYSEWDAIVAPYLEHEEGLSRFETPRSKLVRILEIVFYQVSEAHLPITEETIAKALIDVLNISQFDQIDEHDDDGAIVVNWLAADIVNRIVRLINDDTQGVTAEQAELLEAVGITATNVIGGNLEDHKLGENAVLDRAVEILKEIRREAVGHEYFPWFKLRTDQVNSLNLLDPNSIQANILVSAYREKHNVLDEAIEIIENRGLTVEDMSDSDAALYRQLLEARSNLKTKFKELLTPKLDAIIGVAPHLLDGELVFENEAEFHDAISAVIIPPNKALIDQLNPKLAEILVTEFTGGREWAANVADQYDTTVGAWEGVYDDDFADIELTELDARVIWERNPLDVDALVTLKEELAEDLQNLDDLREQVEEWQKVSDRIELLIRRRWVVDTVRDDLENVADAAIAHIKEAKRQLGHLEGLEDWLDEVSEARIRVKAEEQVHNFSQTYRELLQYSQGVDPITIGEQRNRLKSIWTEPVPIEARKMGVGMLLELSAQTLEQNGKINFAKLEDLIKKNLFKVDRAEAVDIKAVVLIIVESVAKGSGTVSTYQKELLEGIPLNSITEDPAITSCVPGIFIESISKRVNRAPITNWMRNRDVRTENSTTDTARALEAIDQYRETTSSIQSNNNYLLWLGITNKNMLNITNPDDLDLVFDKYQERLSLIDHIAKNKGLLPLGDIDLDEWREGVKDALYNQVYLFGIQTISQPDKHLQLSRIMGDHNIGKMRQRTEAEIPISDAYAVIIVLLKDTPTEFKEALVKHIPFFRNALLVVLHELGRDVQGIYKKYKDAYYAARVDIDTKVQMLNSMADIGLIEVNELRSILLKMPRVLREIEGELNPKVHDGEEIVEEMQADLPLLKDWLPFEDEFVNLNTDLLSKLEDLIYVKNRYVQSVKSFSDRRTNLVSERELKLQQFPQLMQVLDATQAKYKGQKDPNVVLSEAELIEPLWFSNKNVLNPREVVVCLLYTIKPEERKGYTEDGLLTRINTWYSFKVNRGLDLNKPEDRQTQLKRIYAIIDQLWQLINYDTTPIVAGLAEALKLAGVNPQVDVGKFDTTYASILSTDDLLIGEDVMPIPPTNTQPTNPAPTTPSPTVTPRDIFAELDTDLDDNVFRRPPADSPTPPIPPVLPSPPTEPSIPKVEVQTTNESEGLMDEAIRKRIEKRREEIQQLKPEEVFPAIAKEVKNLASLHGDGEVSDELYKQAQAALIIKDRDTQAEWAYNPNTQKWESNESGKWMEGVPPFNTELDFNLSSPEAFLEQFRAPEWAAALAERRQNVPYDVILRIEDYLQQLGVDDGEIDRDAVNVGEDKIGKHVTLPLKEKKVVQPPGGSAETIYAVVVRNLEDPSNLRFVMGLTPNEYIQNYK